MTTASKLSMLRIVLIPFFMWALLAENHIAALVIFIVASITDFVDGYIARHYNQVSDFGKFIDPLADKLLVVSAMLIFLEWGRMPSWAVMLILAREFAVTGLRLVAVQGGKVIAAGWSGKIKTAATMVGLCVMMLFPNSEILDSVVTAIIVVTTVSSGIEYFVQNRNAIALK
ncbi:MAG: CDP-diacylglycerol--glycerol-3-phosphate 3-phosphatidyltransferase [Eubacteriales bacterium]